ncbi:hypothetical protein BH09BAC4_BH09BAC4_30910 [soil metagenome]
MTEFDVLITAQAEADLDRIIEFIRQQWSHSIKTDFLAALSQKMQLLTTMPFMYRASEVEPMVRECTVNRYITMYYRVVEDHKRVEILSFKDNRQQDRHP